MKTPITKDLNLPLIMKEASHLALSGKLSVSPNNLIYLDIDDKYIHTLFPKLNHSKIQKPNYFGKGSAGAHITVIYPEENTIIQNRDLNQLHNFTIEKVSTAEIGLKTYYVLMVKSPTLLQLRRKYGLSDKLYFKGYSINFHITIGFIINT